MLLVSLILSEKDLKVEKLETSFYFLGGSWSGFQKLGVCDFEYNSLPSLGV